jgi:hypothetical protein
MKTYCAAFLIFAATLCAQSQNPPAAPPESTPPPAAETQTTPPTQTSPLPAPEPLPERTYVRRFSLAGTITVLGFGLVPKGSSNPVITSPPVDALYTTTSTSRRFGYGATAQLAVSERWAVAFGGYLRRLGYTMSRDIYTGVDNPSTVEDDRVHTNINENTKARLMDFMGVLRYYGKDRHEPGARWFLEGGAAVRRAYQIETVTDTTVGNADTVYDHTPTSPAHQYVKGLVVGAGVQAVDDVGIRVVPEVRYTRWLASPFQNLTTNVRRDQLEAIISIGF